MSISSTAKTCRNCETCSTEDWPGSRRTTAGLEECVFQAAFLSSTQCAPPPLLPRPRLRAPFGALTKPMSASMAANCCRMSASISSVCVLSMCLRANEPAVCRPPYACKTVPCCLGKTQQISKALLIANAGATVQADVHGRVMQ